MWDDYFCRWLGIVKQKPDDEGGSTMSKFKSAKNLNQKGLAVAGLTSSTVADDTHTDNNQGSSRQQQHNEQNNRTQG